MGRFVIAVYKPKAGQTQALLELARKHGPLLAAQGLITERAPYLMQAADGTVLEVFEWRSPQAIEQAHASPQVQALWEAFGKVCDWLPVSAVPEAQQLFSQFTPVA